MHGRLARARELRVKSGFLKDEAKQKQEKKNLKGNKKVQFVKVSLSLKWKTINLL
jgi:hypothetical protein